VGNNSEQFFFFIQTLERTNVRGNGKEKNPLPAWKKKGRKGKMSGGIAWDSVIDRGKV